MSTFGRMSILGLAGVSLVAALLYLRPDHTSPSSNDSENRSAVNSDEPKNTDTFIYTDIVEGSTRPLDRKKAADSSLGESPHIVSDADAHTLNKLTPWITDEYFAKRQQSYHLRHKLVHIDSAEMTRQIVGKTDDTVSTTGVFSPESELTLSMFDDAQFNVNISTANILADGSVAASGTAMSNHGSLGRVQLYVSAAGKVNGSIKTEDRIYMMTATPELPYYLVVEMENVRVREILAQPKN